MVTSVLWKTLAYGSIRPRLYASAERHSVCSLRDTNDALPANGPDDLRPYSHDAAEWNERNSDDATRYRVHEQFDLENTINYMSRM